MCGEGGEKLWKEIKADNHNCRGTAEVSWGQQDSTENKKGRKVLIMKKNNRWRRIIAMTLAVCMMLTSNGIISLADSFFGAVTDKGDQQGDNLSGGVIQN